MRFDGWTKEDVVSAYNDLERENDQLKEKVRSLDARLSHSNYRIENELEPRIKAEKRAYDRYVTTPRDMP